MEKLTEKLIGGLHDIPTPTDYESEHILGSLPMPEHGMVDLLNGIKIHDQGGTYHCTAYALTHVMQILQTIEHNMRVDLDPEEQWSNQINHGSAKEGWGDSFVSALKMLKKYGLKEQNTHVTETGVFVIDGYSHVTKEVDVYRAHLAAGFPIYTGFPITSDNWRRRRTEGYLPPLNPPINGGHCIIISGYDDDDESFVLADNYGQDWGYFHNGTYRIKYSNLNLLYNGYIVFDSKDLRMIFRDVSEKSPHAENIEWCLENEIIKGYDSENIEDPNKRFYLPEQPVSRAELATIMRRLYNLLKK
jgi:hypothetical protein